MNLSAIAHAYAARPQEWPLAPRWQPGRRWYHRLEARPDWEVWLLTWLPGQHTDLHDHGDSAGAFVVVTGELAEESIDGTKLASRTLTAGAARAFPAGHVHRVAHGGERPAVSVHVYGPALTRMTRYEWVAGRLVVAGVDRAGAQW
jgi:predicted metal-dependent enzyme (double-stranded beta helix superfamily)